MIFRLCFFFSFVTMLSCNSDKVNTQRFTNLQDTLIIQTERIKGNGLFLFGGGFPTFEDTSNTFPHPILYPSELEHIRRCSANMDLVKDSYLDLIIGYKDGVEHYVIDENRNLDLTDDSIRLLTRIDWKNPTDQLIKIDFTVADNNEVIYNSTWVRLGLSHGSILFATNDHLKATFSIEDDIYQIGIQDQVFSSLFNYSVFHSKAALLQNSKEKKDTLYEADLIAVGEYLNLADQYYRFDSISSYGNTIWLIKDITYKDQVGAQVGMMAPQFVGVNLNNDTIASSIFNDQMLVVVNSCACGGDTLSLQAFYDIKERYGDEVHVINLDDFLSNEGNDYQFSIGNPFNQQLKDAYRKMYCERITYVVGKDGRILNKFSSRDWEEILPKIISINQEY